MGNSEKNAVGYVLIGVADKLEDAEKISRKYGVENIRVGANNDSEPVSASEMPAFFAKFNLM